MRAEDKNDLITSFKQRPRNPFLGSSKDAQYVARRVSFFLRKKGSFEFRTCSVRPFLIFLRSVRRISYSGTVVRFLFESQTFPRSLIVIGAFNCDVIFFLFLQILMPIYMSDFWSIEENVSRPKVKIQVSLKLFRASFRRRNKKNS